MPRVPRKLRTTKSEHWLRCAIEHNTAALNVRVRQSFGFPVAEELEWLSPLANDGYAEYSDQAFLDRLGIATTSSPLTSFWPSRGPQWDGLARTKSGKYILVEAKAYPGEAKSVCTATAARSKDKIADSLSRSKQHFGVAEDVCWQHPYYQYANRLAHLYFLRQVCHLDTFLLFLNFADATDMSKPCSADQWKLATDAIEKALGLPLEGKPEGVATIIWSVKHDMDISSCG